MEMRVAMLFDNWWPMVGGTPVHVLELSRHLIARHQCRIDIFTRSLRDEKGRVYKGVESKMSGRLRIFRLPPTINYWNPLGRALYLGSCVIKIGKEYDLVHAHSYDPGFAGYLLHKLKKLPCVFTVHGSGLSHWKDLNPTNSWSGKIREMAEAILLHKLSYSHIISVNPEVAEKLKLYHKHVSYIPNGVEIKKFKGKCKRIPYRILFVGRLEPQKSVDTLIKALPLVLREFPEVKLWVVGDGRLKVESEKLAEKLGVRDNVEFEGSVDEITPYLKKASLFVLPSIFEGQALTLLEAWAVRLPVIATNVEGIKSVVRDRVNGLLVPKKNPKALANAIVYAFNNPKEAKRWGEEGYKTVRKNHRWEEIADRTYEIYCQVLDNE